MPATATETIVLGRDAIGTVAESDGMRFYLTECCGASAKGCDGYVGCRACYAEVDPMLGDVPDKAMRSVEGRWAFVDRPLSLVEVYGDGLTYDAWVAERPEVAANQAENARQNAALSARIAR